MGLHIGILNWYHLSKMAAEKNNGKPLKKQQQQKCHKQNINLFEFWVVDYNYDHI